MTANLCPSSSVGLGLNDCLFTATTGQVLALINKPFSSLNTQLIGMLHGLTGEVHTVLDHDMLLKMQMNL